MKIIFSLFALIMITESCNSAKETIDNSAKNVQTLSGTYSISQIGQNNSISEELSVTFENSTHRVSGFAGCNTFFGTYSLDDKKLTLENLASSKKFCQKEVNNVEHHLIIALNRINTFSLNENGISLLEDDTILLKAIRSNPVKDN